MTLLAAVAGLAVAGWMIFAGRITQDSGRFADAIVYQLRPLGIVLAVLVVLLTPALLLFAVVAEAWLREH